MHPRDVSHFYKDLFFDGVVVKQDGFERVGRLVVAGKNFNVLVGGAS